MTSTHTERDPLLSPAGRRSLDYTQPNEQDARVIAEDALASQRPRRRKTPLKKLQLFLVMSVQFSEPVTGTVIYPFINQLVRETGVTGPDERKTGYYAGVIESLFFLTECFTVYSWGRAADSRRIGRRPVLLLGTAFSALAIFAFGLGNIFGTGEWWGVNKWFAMLALTRSVQGVCNGNIGVTKSVMAEITDASNMGDAFAFIPVVWATGMTLGPIIGGTLAHPATTFPSSPFGTLPLFQKFPYFLPCAMAALVPAVSFLAGWWWLEETLPAIVNKEKKKVDAEARGDAVAHDHRRPDGEVDADADATPSPSFLSLLSQKQVLIPIVNHSFLALMEQCFTVLIPLVYSTSIQNGGLGFSAFRIGTIMGIVGFVNGLCQFLLFSPCLARLGPKNLFTLCYATIFVALLCFPIMTVSARAAGRVDGVTWAVLVLQLCCNVPIYMGYGCSFLFTVDSAPTPALLSSTNGLAQLTSTVIRSIGPTLASSLFSVTIQRRLMGGTMVYWVLCAVGSVGLWTARLLPVGLKGA